MATKLTYSEQLKHPNWQRKRLETLEAADFTCTDCGCKDKTLHVHHKRYVKGRSAWEYTANELVVLCEDCHTASHEVKEALAEVLLATFQDYPAEEFALGLLGGFLGSMGGISPALMLKCAELASPSWELGVLLAACGPTDLSAAVRKKVADGRIPADNMMLSEILKQYPEA